MKPKQISGGRMKTEKGGMLEAIAVGFSENTSTSTSTGLID